MNDLILKQVESIIDPKLPLVSNLSNVSSILKQTKDLNWAGFYLVQNETLYLGPFQGEVACTTIKKGNGVCGTAFLKKETIIVDDVNKFEGHIACSKLSKSEIVVPIMKNNEVLGVIDLDSPKLARFNKNHQQILEKIAELLAKLFY